MVIFVGFMGIIETMKVVSLAAAVFTAAFGFLFHVNIPPVVLPESAVVYNAAAPIPVLPADATFSTAQSTSTAVAALPPIPPGMLPKVHVLKFKSATVAAFAAAKIKGASTAPAASNPAPAPVIKMTASPVTATPLPSTITAQWILDHTTLSFKERFDGTYAVVFTSALGGNNNLAWGLDQSSIGGTGSIPKFSITFICDPPPAMPAFDSRDQSPAFKVRTTYGCDISLAATSGNDQSMKTKHFDFQTNAGPLVIRLASAIDTVLKNDKNVGSFVFDNEDSDPITVTNVTFDASFVTLSTSSNPLVVRFLDPITENILYDYHLENIPADPAKQFSAAQTGITVPVSFTVPGNTERALPINVVGVRKMSVSGINPSITITLRGVGLTDATIKKELQSPSITWTCVTPTGAYDPNSLTDAFATGQACTQ